jgi:succinate-semialdehyde dehydrogenase / glutarate-semialdehyde dehydrogenase
MQLRHVQKVLPQWHARLAGGLDRASTTFPVVNPATGLVIAQVSACRRQQALLAIDAACSVASAWRDTAPGTRSALLRNWAARLIGESERIATSVTLETGKPIGEARREVGEAVRAIEYFAEQNRLTDVALFMERAGERRIEHKLRPVGPVVAITNWCQPVLTSVCQIAPALAAGCPVILKPSSRAPLSALTAASLWDDAGGPSGTLQVLTTDDSMVAVEVFLTDARIGPVSFTGSLDVGRYLARRCADARKDVSLEVDGQNPFIVLRDADLKRAADAVVAVTFQRNAGQDCTSANRIYVDQHIADRFIRAVVERTAELRCGDPLDPRTDVGPLIDSVALTLLDERIEDSVADGARVATGGRRLGGLYFAPTVLDHVMPGMRAAEDACAGPLLPALRFASKEAVVDMAMSTGKGRTVWIWSRNYAAARGLATELGYDDVWINDMREAHSDQPDTGVVGADFAELARDA